MGQAIFGLKWYGRLRDGWVAAEGAVVATPDADLNSDAIAEAARALHPRADPAVLDEAAAAEFAFLVRLRNAVIKLGRPALLLWDRHDIDPKDLRGELGDGTPELTVAIARDEEIVIALDRRAPSPTIEDIRDCAYFCANVHPDDVAEEGPGAQAEAAELRAALEPAALLECAYLAELREAVNDEGAKARAQWDQVAPHAFEQIRRYGGPSDPVRVIDIVERRQRGHPWTLEFQRAVADADWLARERYLWSAVADEAPVVGARIPPSVEALADVAARSEEALGEPAMEQLLTALETSRQGATWNSVKALAPAQLGRAIWRSALDDDPRAFDDFSSAPRSHA